jgi:hypothetical protein
VFGSRWRYGKCSKVDRMILHYEDMRRAALILRLIHAVTMCYTLHAILTYSTTPPSILPHLRLLCRGADSTTQGRDQDRHIAIESSSSLSSNAFTPFYPCDRFAPMSSASCIIRILTPRVRFRLLSYTLPCSKPTPHLPISFEVFIFGLPWLPPS